MTVEDITYETGFKSIKSLNRVYNKYIDMTPSQYRRDYTFSSKDYVSEEDLHASEDYQNFIRKYSYLTYDSFYKNKNSIVSHQVNSKKVLESVDKKVFEIYELDSLGNNYVENFKKISSNINIDFIMLKLSIAEEINRVYLDDLNISISLYELLLFLEELRYKNTRVALRVNIMEFELKEIMNNSDFKLKYEEKLSDFYEKLINVMTKTRAKEIEWVLDLGGFVDSNMNSNIGNIMEYIKVRKNILEKSIGGEYIYSFDLGSHSINDLKDARNFYDKNKISKSYPKRVYFGIENKNKIKLEDTGAYEEVFNRYKENIYPMERLNSKTILDKSELVISDISSIAEVEFCDPRYMDLTLSYIILDIITKLNIQVRELMGIKIKNEYLESINKTALIGKEGFLTPIYYVINFLSKMAGDVLSKEEGFIVTKCGGDFNVLIYGNMMYDYQYASRLKFDNLDRHSREVSYKIDGLEGKYKVVKKKLSLEYGEPEYYLQDFENREYLNPAERSYIESLSRPRQKVNFLEASGSIEDKAVLEPYTIVFIRYLQI